MGGKKVLAGIGAHDEAAHRIDRTDLAFDGTGGRGEERASAA